MKKIYVRSDYKLHNLYKTLFNTSFDNYQFIVEEPSQKPSKPKTRLKKLIFNFAKIFVNPVKIRDENFSKKNLPKDVDFIFSTGHLILREDIPYILDIVDKLTVITGYDYNLFLRNKKYLEQMLLRPNLKKITVWTEACKKDFDLEFNNPEINKKIEVVNIACPLVPLNYKKNFNKNEVNLLFIGSINNPDDFIIKGGIETLETFSRLTFEYDNVHLYFRCKIPEKYLKKYSGLKNLHVIESLLSEDEIKKLYENTDIFMTPSHNLNFLAPVEAMTYCLPLIAIDSWSIDEVVINNFNGFLIKKSELIPYEKDKIHLRLREPKYLKMFENVDEALISRLVEKTKFLIDNPKTRREMGENSRKMVENGKLSYSNRIKKFKQIFDSIHL